MRFFQILMRCCRLRCPDCGQGKLYRNLISMNSKCEVCDLPFDRGGGFYLGAIYFNYGLTALVVSVAYPLLVLTQTMSANVALAVCMSFVVIFPMLFYRWARSLWLGLDELFDPQGKSKDARRPNESP